MNGLEKLRNQFEVMEPRMNATSNQLLEALYWWPLFNGTMDMDDFIVINKIGTPYAEVHYRSEWFIRKQFEIRKELLKDVLF